MLFVIVSVASSSLNIKEIMKFFLWILKGILTSGFPENTDTNILRRVKVINVTNIIPIFLSIAFLIYNAQNNEWFFFLTRFYNSF